MRAYIQPKFCIGQEIVSGDISGVVIELLQEKDCFGFRQYRVRDESGNTHIVSEDLMSPQVEYLANA